jgi:hypothetical protein
MIAIMTILPRDAIAGVGGRSGVLVKPRTTFSLSQTLCYVQRHAAVPESGLKITRLHLQRESLRIRNHPSSI